MELETLIKQCDADGSGQIEFDEFEGLMEKLKIMEE